MIAPRQPDPENESRESQPRNVLLAVLPREADGERILQALRDAAPSVPVMLVPTRNGEGEAVRRLIARGTGGAEETSPKETIRFGSVEVDLASRKVMREGREVVLAPRAFDLLVALHQAGGRVLSRQALLREVWGHRSEVLTRTVDSHIWELRKKLEEDPARPRFIRTVWKAGYRFEFAS